MSEGAEPNPPRDGEGDRAKRGGGGSRPMQRPIVSRARKLRKSMTPPEVALWQYLRKKPSNLKFRRQHPVTNDYVADFFCSSAKVAVEIDGQVHNIVSVADRDEKRNAVFVSLGIRIFRLTAADVLRTAAAAVNAIVAFAESPHHHPSDGPPPRSGED